MPTICKKNVTLIYKMSDDIIHMIQVFIKEQKQEPDKFKSLKELLNKHLLIKKKKMKELELNELIYFIHELRTYIELYELDYNILLENIKNLLYENNMLQF